MLKLLERNIATIERRLILLAPPQATLPDTFTNVTADADRHEHFVREMQLLRGSIYLNEGNVKREQLSVDGLHQTPEDEQSWHLLLTEDGQVTSCAWYRDCDNTINFEKLRVRHCPLAKMAQWRDTLRGAVESELARAQRDGLRYAELGGWAIAKERRCTPEGWLMALATYNLSRSLGGALGMTTANVEHSCSSILRRFGGSSMEHEGTQLPTYFDPRYNTHIELLRFDSRSAGGKYAGLMQTAQATFANVSVISRDATRESERSVVLRPVALRGMSSIDCVSAA